MAWKDVEQPILEAIAALQDEKHGAPISRVSEVVERTELEPELVRNVLGDLVSAGYVEAAPIEVMESVTPVDWLNIRLLERGKVTTRRWPDSYAAFLQTLQEQIDATDDPEEQSKLEQVRDGFLRLSGNVATNVLATFLARAAGL